MQRIDDVTAAAALPVPEPAATPGYWQEGNAVTGQVATRERASWFNGVTEELMSILAAAGIAGNKTLYNQVLTALLQLFGGNVTTLTAATVLTAAQSGLVLLDATAGSFAVTLPVGSSALPLGFRFVKIKTDINSVTIQAAGAADIFGQSVPGGAGSISLAIPGSSVALQPNPATGNWHMVGGVGQAMKLYAGNPNGNVAGNANVGGTSEQCYDSSNHILYVCTQTGPAATAVWSPVAGVATSYAGTLPATGTANALVVAALLPGGFTLQAGFSVTITPSVNNTGASSLAAGGTAVTAINKLSGGALVALAGGELVAGVPVTLIFNGAVWVIGTGTFGALAYLNAGAGLQADGAGGARVNFPIVHVTANQAVTAAFHGNEYVLDAPATFTLAAASSYWSGFKLRYFALGGALTVALASGTDTINGGTAGAALVVPEGYCGEVTTDASGKWFVKYSPAVAGGTAIPFSNYAKFVAPGSTGWVVPAGITRIKGRVGGGGGGACGGGGSSTGGSTGAAGGLDEDFLSVTPGETLTIVVGSAGAGSTSPANAGNGETSGIYRGSTPLLEATGGAGGGGIPGAAGGGIGQHGTVQMQGQGGTDLNSAVTWAAGGNSPMGGMGGTANGAPGGASSSISPTWPGGGGGGAVAAGPGQNGANGGVIINY
jgi:hypothetical protein